MSENLKERIVWLKRGRIVTALLAVALGVLFVVMPEASADALAALSGILLLLAGAVSFAVFLRYGIVAGNRMLIAAIVLALAGIFCLVHPVAVQTVLGVIFGMLIIIDGSQFLAAGIECARVKMKGWLLMLLLSLLIVVFGGIVLLGSFDAFMVFVGIALIADGICKLIITCAFSYRINEAKKRLNEMRNTIYID